MLSRTLLGCLVLLGVAGFASAQTGELLPADRPIEKVVDHYVNAGLKKANVKAVNRADDHAILRRVMLDLVGRIPTLEETQGYLADTAPDKKARLVDRLMASPGFVRHQAQELATLLDYQEPGRKRKKSELQGYLLTAVGEKRGWDRIFRDVLLPDQNDAKMKGASEFLKSRVKDPTRLTIDVSSLFFGVNVSCAQCHDHPHVQAWTQDHFFGMKAFLARTVDSGGFLVEKEFGAVKYLPHKGKEKVAPVMFLTGKTIVDPGMREPNAAEKKKEQERLATGKNKKVPDPPEFSLRAKLVETALEPDQRDYFTRNLANRMWYRFMGQGLVMPLDQMHQANPSSHPDLLQWLARDLAEHQYDLRRIVRGLVLSETYARSSRWEGSPQPAASLFAVAQPRALTPTQLATSLKLAATDPDRFLIESAPVEQTLETLEKQAARWAPFFPDPGDRFQVSVSEAMFFSNNEELLKDLLDGPKSLPVYLTQFNQPEQQAVQAIRVVLGRSPRAEETKAIANYLRERSDRPLDASKQAVWALLTSAEFRFNH